MLDSDTEKQTPLAVSYVICKTGKKGAKKSATFIMLYESRGAVVSGLTVYEKLAKKTRYIFLEIGLTGEETISQLDAYNF